MLFQIKEWKKEKRKVALCLDDMMDSIFVNEQEK